jgi:hypothetical protein
MRFIKNESVLERRGKLTAAIAETVTKQLRPAVENLFQSQTEADTAEAGLALGDVSAGGLEKAHERVLKARAAVDTIAGKLRALRGTLGALGAELTERYRQVSAELPKHNAKVAADFSKEWNKAAAAFSLVLGRRAAIEAQTGARLQLSEPAPIAVDLEDSIGGPKRELDGLKQGIDELAMAYQQATPPMTSPNSPTYYPDRIYRLVRPARPANDLPAGALVVDASFDPGVLRRLVTFGDAVLASDQIAEAGLVAAGAAAREIQAQTRAEERAAEEQQRQEKAAKEDGTLKVAQPYPDLSPEDRAKRLSGELFRREREAAEEAERNGPSERTIGVNADVASIQADLAKLREDGGQ